MIIWIINTLIKKIFCNIRLDINYLKRDYSSYHNLLIFNRMLERRNRKIKRLQFRRLKVRFIMRSKWALQSKYFIFYLSTLKLEKTKRIARYSTTKSLIKYNVFSILSACSFFDKINEIIKKKNTLISHATNIWLSKSLTKLIN